MSTIMEEALDSDMFVVLDFDYEVPCDMNQCDNAAEWRTVIVCCGRTVLYCDEDFQNILEAIGTYTFLCDADSGGCGSKMNGSPFIFTEKLKK